MVRALLTVLLPVALPVLVYLGYLRFARARAQAAGGDEAALRNTERVLLWILGAGVAVVIGALVAMRLTSGVPPNAKLEAPRLVDGKVVPSHVVE